MSIFRLEELEQNNFCQFHLKIFNTVVFSKQAPIYQINTNQQIDRHSLQQACEETGKKSTNFSKLMMMFSVSALSVYKQLCANILATTNHPLVSQSFWREGEKISGRETRNCLVFCLQ